jgi:hypothetical protein
MSVFPPQASPLGLTRTLFDVPTRTSRSRFAVNGRMVSHAVRASASPTPAAPKVARPGGRTRDHGDGDHLLGSVKDFSELLDPDVTVSQKLLDGPDVVPRLEQVGRERVAKGVRAGALGDRGRL